MPQFKCSYAYDVPHYFDFVVSAKDEEEAERVIEEALKSGAFNEADTEPFYENTDNARVFVSGPLPPDEEGVDPVLTTAGGTFTFA